MDIKLRVKSGKYIHQVQARIETLNSKTLQIRFPYNALLIEEIKQFKGARYIPPQEGGPAWNISNCERNTYCLKYLMGWKDEHYQAGMHTIDMPFDVVDYHKLFQHQKDAIDFIIIRRRCMIAFEMGLGKTLIMIRVMELAAEQGFYHWWLVAPYGAQQEWKRQLIRWKAKVKPVIISTYESLHKPMDSMDEIPHGVIFDESIKIKNPAAQRSQIAAELCKIVRKNNSKSFLVTLSGAPAPQDPTDWWHQIEVLCPGFIREGNIHKFRNRYANIEFEIGEFGKYPVLKSWKEDEVKKLGKRLQPIVIVRKKKDCLELPDKIFDVIKCNQESQSEHNRIIDLIVGTTDTAVNALMLLRELSDGFKYRGTETERDTSLPGHNILVQNKKYDWIGSPKFTIIDELLDFYHTDNGGPGRLVIYAAFTATLDELEKFVSMKKWNCARIDGRGWSDEKFLDIFASSGSNLCLVANPACVHGISLQRTECFIYYSNDFSVDHRIQSMDRRDRPGMDMNKGTRIVDIINLPIDQLILDRLNSGIGLQNITLEEIKLCLLNH